MRTTDKMPRVAILLAAHNGLLWLREQVDSILLQREVVLTLFVSIDCSQDGTEEWFNNISKNNSDVIVLPCGDKYGGAARNFYRLIRDVSIEKYDYVSLSDQDDIWDHSKIQRAINILNMREIDGYSSNVIAFWDNGKTKLINKSQQMTKWDHFFESAGPGCTFVMNKKLFTDIKTLVIDNWYYVQNIELHDWLFYAYARQHNYRWFIDPFPSVSYRQHGDNQVGANVGFRAFFCRLEKVVDGMAMNQAILIAKLITDNNKFTKMWIKGSRVGFLYLALNSPKCRRKLVDKFIFFLSCLILSIIGLRVK